MASSPSQRGAARERRINKIVNEVSTASPPDITNEWVSATGVKFRLNKFPRSSIIAAIRKVEVPQVPVMYNEDKDRDEPNPNDPTYLREMQMADYEAFRITGDIFVAYGTSVLEETIPSGTEKYTDTEWAETLKLISGIEVPTGGRARYLSWVRYYLLIDEEFALLQKAAMDYMGFVMPEEVAQAEAAFPGAPERDTDSGAPAETES